MAIDRDLGEFLKRNQISEKEAESMVRLWFEHNFSYSEETNIISVKNPTQEDLVLSVDPDNFLKIFGDNELRKEIALLVCSLGESIT